MILDEFQEISRLNHLEEVKKTVGDLYRFLRSRWQNQTGVAYLISGSRPAMLNEIVTGVVPQSVIVGE